MSAPVNSASLIWALFDALVLLAFIVSSTLASIHDATFRVLDDRTGNFLLVLGSFCFAVNGFARHSFTWIVGVKSIALGYMMTYLLNRLGIMGLGDVKYLVSTFLMFPTAGSLPHASVPLPVSVSPGGLTYPFSVVVIANSLVFAIGYLAMKGFTKGLSRFSLLSLAAGAMAAVVSPLAACLALAPLAVRSEPTEVPFIPFAFGGTLLSLIIGGRWRGLI